MKEDSTPVPIQPGFTLARYTLKNTTDSEVFQNYEDKLKKDGWSIIEQQKPTTFVAKKGEHQATFVVIQNNKDVSLTISSK